MARLPHLVCVVALAAVVSAALALSATPAGATGSHGGGGWPTQPANCPIPFAPVVPKPAGFLPNKQGCARLICPVGFTPESPYNDGSSAVFYSLAQATKQALWDLKSTLGCIKTADPIYQPVGSLPSWMDHGLCWLFGLPTYRQLVNNRR